jgi:hypothetical protein
LPTQASRPAKAGAATRRPGRPPGAATVLERVRVILAETCEQDGQGTNLQEVARRKAYRAGINRALALIETSQRQAR